MPSSARKFGNNSKLNCGTLRERGIERTSTTRSILTCFSSTMNSAIVRVECPIVKIVRPTSGDFVIIVLLPLERSEGINHVSEIDRNCFALVFYSWMRFMDPSDKGCLEPELANPFAWPREAGCVSSQRHEHGKQHCAGRRISSIRYPGHSGRAWAASRNALFSPIARAIGS